MTVDQFRHTSLGELSPGRSGALVALWHEAQGDWAAAHASAQDDDSPNGAWVHAHLHRKEGDLANASYWYRRAGRPIPTGGMDSEWTQITGELLGAEKS